MDQESITDAFRTAAVEFDVQAKNGGAEIIGHAHALYFQHRRMSPGQIEIEIEHIRTAMLALNAAFTRLDLARAAMTVGEAASRIRQAVERK